MTNTEKTTQVLEELAGRDRQIFTDPAGLTEALTGMGLSAAEIHKILLMTDVTGFGALVQKAPEVRQLDIERYVTNAMLETGLRKDTILSLTAAMLIPMGVSGKWTLPAGTEEEKTPAPTYVIPDDTYAALLEPYEAAFRCAVRETPSAAEPDYTKLIPLAEAGLPGAQLYLGTHMISQEDKNAREYGLELLEAADHAGEGRAAAVLGDYWFRCQTTDGLQKAYEYYTAYGGEALTEPQRKRFRELLGTKKYNFARLCSGIFLWALLIVCSMVLQQDLFLPAALGLVFKGLGALYLVFQSIRYCRGPYNRFGFVPLTVSLLWFAEILARYLLN